MDTSASTPHGRDEDEARTRDHLYSIRVDGSRRKIHPADVHGRWLTRRRIVFAVLIGIYVALPLLHVGGHPAVHLDVEARRFYLFGGAFNAQDFWLVLFVALASGFGLLFATAWLGRAWCGWACPQSVFLEGVYRPIERLIEGSREKRIRREHGPWTLDRTARALLRHAAWLAVSLALAHVALALFVSTSGVTECVRHSPLAHPEAFAWTMGITAVVYFDFAWFREQFCIVMCPYGRLQSALVDADSITVGYDRRRGEPRGKRGAPGAGDCVDCKRCVVVCPTGIDIRQGLQMECLACTQCIDACDDIMDRLGRPRGLIRYDSTRVLDEGGKRANLMRPRLVVYGALTLLAIVAAIASGVERRPFEANLLRLPGAPYVLDGNVLRNSLALHVVSKHPEPADFTLRARVPASATVTMPQTTLHLDPMESVRVPIFVSMPVAAFRGSFDIVVEIGDGGGERPREARARFLGPPVAP